MAETVTRAETQRMRRWPGKNVITLKWGNGKLKIRFNSIFPRHCSQVKYETLKMKRPEWPIWYLKNKNTVQSLFHLSHLYLPSKSLWAPLFYISIENINSGHLLRDDAEGMPYHFTYWGYRNAQNSNKNPLSHETCIIENGEKIN